MEREVGGRIGMGNTCKPMAVSFQCMTKSTTNKKNNKKKKKHRILDLLELLFLVEETLSPAPLVLWIKIQGKGLPLWSSG